MSSKRKSRESAAPAPDQLQLFHPAPPRIAALLFFTAFAIPNLVFSGGYFFDALHLMKWVFTFGPVALLGGLAGFRLLRFGAERTAFRLDAFSVVWLALLVYMTAQPSWAVVRSWPTLCREWFALASLWLTYVLAINLADRGLVRALLWGALVNAAVNVLFAELQIRGLEASLPFVYPSGANYIGNTGQQNMFAFWMALAGLGGATLLLEAPPARERPVLNVALAALLFTVFWGLVFSTSRSGMLSLLVGLAVMAAMLLRTGGRRHLPRIACTALLFMLAFGVILGMGSKQSAAILSKAEDMVTNPLSIANRDSIWATSWTMFKGEPWRGAGLGQFKWHYIDAVNEMLKTRPHFRIHYTHWAHNEFLQWMAEAGIVGAALMFSLWIWWGLSAWRAFYNRKPISPEAIWGSAVAACFLFNALWTRPFHRVENVIWLALAFAVTNREIMAGVPSSRTTERRRDLAFARARRIGYRLLGAAICAVSVMGLLFLADGVRGNMLLYRAGGREGGSVTATTELYRVAHGSLMVRDTVEREVGYFSVEVGEATDNPRMIADGLNVLTDYFVHQPHPQDLYFLLNWARKIGKPEYLEFIESFIYRQPADARPASGESEESGERE